jgi:hypothetical protein
MKPEDLYASLYDTSCSQNAENAFTFYVRQYSSDFRKNKVKVVNK